MTNHAGRSNSLARPGRLRRWLAGTPLLLALACGFPPAPQVAAEDPAPAPQLALHFEPNPLVLRAISTQIEAIEASPLDRAPERRASLGEVFWTVPEPTPADALATTWGVGKDRLYALNPDLGPGSLVPAGTALKVFEVDPEEPTRSIGAPNRGKLQNGMPIPEGDAWRLRTMRRRAYGTELTVTTLVDAFNAYGERFPDGPKIRVGELAMRKGGKVSPHRSHRSGRDVDIGYVFVGEDDGDVRWRQMNEDNFDAEKNWFLMHEMIKTGNVEAIFVSKRLQKLLYAEAVKHLDDAELATIFQYPRTAETKDPLIRHWKGHRDHMHVRFRCEDDNRRCRSAKSAAAH